MFVDLSESEDSFYYGAPEPLDRSDGEIGGDIYMKNLIDRRPEPGLAKIAGAPKQRTNQLGQTQGFIKNVPSDGVKDPIYDSGEGPVVVNKNGKGGNAVYQSAESFGGNKIKGRAPNKFGARQQIREDFLDDDLDDYNESGEIDPSLFL